MVLYSGFIYSQLSVTHIYSIAVEEPPSNDLKEKAKLKQRSEFQNRVRAQSMFYPGT